MSKPKVNDSDYTLGYAVDNLFTDGTQYYFYIGNRQYQHIGTLIDKDSLTQNKLEVVYDTKLQKYSVFNLNHQNIYNKPIVIVPF